MRLYFNDCVVIGVDNSAIAKVSSAGSILIIEMDMAVDKISGFEDLKKPEKGLEALVAGICLVMNACWWGMGYQDIYKATMEKAINKKMGDKFKYSP